MPTGMGLALGDAESEDEEDLFGNEKDLDKKNENEANW